MGTNGGALPGGLEGTNSLLAVTLTLSDQRPNLEEELAKVGALQVAYDAYNLRRETNAVLAENSFVAEEEMEVGDHRGIYESVYIEENREGFEEEIALSAYIADVVTVGNLVNEYSQVYPYERFQQGNCPKVGDYIRASEWFAGLSQERKDRLNFALGQLNNWTYRFPTQVTQCVTWAIFLADLGYPTSPVQVGGYDIHFARELIPTEMRGSGGPREIWQGGAQRYISAESLNDYEPGDLFVWQNLPYSEWAGHVGAVVAKKQIDGQTALLVSDANRGFDGRVRLFRITRVNQYAILGHPPLNWVILRRAN
jgi:hypothetical protein